MSYLDDLDDIDDDAGDTERRRTGVRATALAVVVVWVAVIAGYAIAFGRPAWTWVDGTATTAYLTHCDANAGKEGFPQRVRASCKGQWEVHEKLGRGAVYGTNDGRLKNSDVALEVRASGSRAVTVDAYLELRLWALTAALVGGAATCVVLLGHFWRRRGPT